jgi:hypothetical protein
MRETVAVVIPVWKVNLTEYEYISFLQACRVLNKYKFILVSYRKLDISKYTNILENVGVDYKITYFNKRYFKCTDDYNSLMLSVRFYSKFLFYKYILIYQLDCFVFRDDLDLWVKERCSFVGAPWHKDYYQSMNGVPVFGVGNGGLSLRSVKDHIRVLLSFSYVQKPKELFKKIYSDSKNNAIYKLLELVAYLTFLNNTFFILNNWKKNEDIFWGEIAKRNFFWFKVPDWKVAAKFSVEVQPGYFIELNGGSIPFGCHAWWTYDFDFWKPYIESFGHKLNKLPNDYK